MIKGTHLIAIALSIALFAAAMVWAMAYYYESSSASGNVNTMEFLKGDSASGSDGNRSGSGGAPPDAEEMRTINVLNDSKLGPRLVSSDGRSLYDFANDSSGVSSCTGNCAANWPPYLINPEDRLTAGAGTSGAVATVVRSDGSLQVTYEGKPLYFWHGDKEPGDALGQGIGGVWFVTEP